MSDNILNSLKLRKEFIKTFLEKKLKLNNATDILKKDYYLYVFELYGSHLLKHNRGFICKIGFSKNIESRLLTLQTHCPFKLRVNFQYKSKFSRYLEVYWHYEFREHCLKGEWFLLSPQQIERIENETPKLDNNEFMKLKYPEIYSKYISSGYKNGANLPQVLEFSKDE